MNKESAQPLIRTIEYPYLPEGREILYVNADNSFMEAARENAINSLDKNVPTSSVIVKDDAIIGKGANGSSYHETHECERVRQGIPTGQGYELCEGCHPKNHSEVRAIEDAKQAGHDVEGADLYLWGHWWCCQPCWDAMISAGIKNIYLQEDSEKLFNKQRKATI